MSFLHEYWPLLLICPIVIIGIAVCTYLTYKEHRKKRTLFLGGSVILSSICATVLVFVFNKKGVTF